MIMLSVEEFEEQYARRSGVTVEWLHEHGRRGGPCGCGEDGCEGWQMLRGEFAWYPRHEHYRPPLVEITCFGDDVRTFISPSEGVLRIPYDVVAFRFDGDAPNDADVHSDNGDALRSLDEVLEEQRQRIAALGRRTSR